MLIEMHYLFFSINSTLIGCWHVWVYNIQQNTSYSRAFINVNITHATVIPRLKKVGADPTDVQNYRPISNLTCMSKVVEKLVCRQLTAYLEENGLFPRLQSAYRRFHSTEIGILKLACDALLYSSWSRGRYTTGSPRSLSCIWYCRS